MEKVAIIGTVGYPSRYGGFETLVHHLVEQLKHQVKFTVYCSSKHYPKKDRPAPTADLRLVYLPLNANGSQSIIYDLFSMIHALFVADTLLILGVSGCAFLPLIRLISRKKIIVNIDGLEWKRDKWGKFGKWYLKWSERMAVRWAHAHIADNEAIRQYVAWEYNAVSELIEYGADHVIPGKPTTEMYKRYPFLRKSYAFKVARIEPENNIDLILTAFADSTINLVIVGNWNNSAYGKNLREKYGDHPNLYLLDPIYNQKELDMLRSNCWSYVHGHKAGGTNPSLVEAMYLGLPIIAFDVNYNKETTEYSALYFKNIEELQELIAMINYPQLRTIGTTMKQIATRRYNWKRIAQRYYQLFELPIHAIRKQPFVREQSDNEVHFLRNAQLNHLLHTRPYFEEPDSTE